MRALRRLVRDQRGVTVVEFGLLAPVMCLMLMGLFDLLHRVYAQDILDGEMQRVARDSALEGGPLKAAEIDLRMKRMEWIVASGATIDVTRDTYPSFLAVKPERFDDTNGNGVRDKGECFDDINENKMWDTRPSRTGQGGANDVTVIRTVVKFPRLLPMGAMLGWGNQQKVVSETVLKNQPFAAQAVATVSTICT